MSNENNRNQKADDVIDAVIALLVDLDETCIELTAVKGNLAINVAIEAGRPDGYKEELTDD